MSDPCESADAVVVLVEWVRATEDGPPQMKPPTVFMGPDRVRRAEQRAMELYDNDQASTGFLSTVDADAARARWLNQLKKGMPVPLNGRSSLRWRQVVGER